MLFLFKRHSGWNSRKKKITPKRWSVQGRLCTYQSPQEENHRFEDNAAASKAPQPQSVIPWRVLFFWEGGLGHKIQTSLWMHDKLSNSTQSTGHQHTPSPSPTQGCRPLWGTDALCAVRQTKHRIRQTHMEHSSQLQPERQERSSSVRRILNPYGFTCSRMNVTRKLLWGKEIERRKKKESIEKLGFTRSHLEFLQGSL